MARTLDTISKAKPLQKIHSLKWGDNHGDTQVCDSRRDIPQGPPRGKGSGPTGDSYTLFQKPLSLDTPNWNSGGQAGRDDALSFFCTSEGTNPWLIGVLALTPQGTLGKCQGS